MNFIDKLSDKNYIKNIDNKSGAELSDEIRKFLIDNIFVTGGHLASNLGVVELTIALHKVFNFPEDKIVFDVGHQSYVHKILSGRYDKFDTLRKFGGLSGFPKTEESEYDSFNTGHSSTSISAALGIARARDLKKQNFNVIAFTGDGALGGGMSFEALNDAGDSDTKIIIILNDNEMSINKVVGGLSAHLSLLRLEKKYIIAKNHLYNILSKTGAFGKSLINFARDAKKAIKFATIAAPMFEDLGIKYIGIIDGHNIDDLTAAFEKAKNIQGPVIVHTLTTKGKGFKKAEDNPDLYHGVGPKTDDTIVRKLTYTELIGKYIVKKAAENKNIVAITAAMTSGCGLTEFSKMYSDRFFDVGIAEQHAVTMAAGMATRGIIPIFTVYSTFLQRGYDQILHDVCIQNLHVVFAIDRAGVVGEDGETHQGIFDFSFLLHIPKIKVLAPSCRKEFLQMLDYAIDDATGPVAIRYPKAQASTRICSDFVPEEVEIVYENGNDVVLISIGRMLERCLETANILSEHNFGVKVINVRTVKPLNTEPLKKIISDCKIACTVEDNVINGGAGMYIKSVLPMNLHLKIINIGYDDCFVKQGTQTQLLDYYGLSPEVISKRIEKELENNE